MRRMMGGLFVALIVFAVSFVMLSGDAWAMPNFARRYNVDCSMCHVAVPKLNKTGYEFRNAGYRFPDDIGKDADANFNLGDFFAARIQVFYKWQKHNADAAAGSKDPDFTNSQLEFKEVTLYPLTGSWGKHFGSLAELSSAPGESESVEFENAYVRYVNGSKDGWWQGRIGIMHAFEGMGASDRPISLSRPLFQTMTASDLPQYKLWSKDEVAAEVGYNMASTGTTVSVRISNGVTEGRDPAQGGALTKSVGDRAQNDKSYQLFINQFIIGDSAVSFHYYYGRVQLDANSDYRATFQRFTGYANYWVMPDMLDILAGYSYGHDYVDSPPGATALSSRSDNSYGYFVEADYHVNPQLAFAYRYDKFDPSKSTRDDKTTAHTLSCNYYFMHGLQAIVDYQHKNTDVVTTGLGDTKDDTVQARMIFIW